MFGMLTTSGRNDNLEDVFGANCVKPLFDLKENEWELV
jgi:hypothetical protein